MVHDAEPRSAAQVEFSVPTMMCDGCAEKIGDALAIVSGVYDVKPKLWRKRVRIRYDASKVTREQLAQVLGGIGFSVSEV